MNETPKNQTDLPLVSCVMPTYNRRRFVPFAIEYFLRQQYINKELIIIDDGEDLVRDLIPEHPLIKYFSLNKKITLGAKLNLACNYAEGEIIANWDDDDWYADCRLYYQVEALKNYDAEVCGINKLLYYDAKKNVGYQYLYPANHRPWLLGSSLCYTKKLWQKNRFADINIGMDGLFVWGVPPAKVKALDDTAMSVHMIHENNISFKKTDESCWHKYPVEELRRIMKDDWYLYNKEAKPIKAEVVVTADKTNNINYDTIKPLNNVYACLVHENEDCIIDLVRNLHYHDPSSIILIYNGGNNKNLFTNKFSYDKFNALIHLDSTPVKHGYLHNFAINTMQFAIDNFSFDCLTIVDSDQLAIRPGYSKYIKAAFASPAVGMLSCKPKRLRVNDTNDAQVWPAIQAFKEYNLWKPFLEKFKDGERKFVHWTFWPSTAFSVNAVKDLIHLFREDKQLQQIMQQTKIWATEEVILSTLVALLGYNIAENPCSYDFVKYKKNFQLQEVYSALNKPDAYWMHPVKRDYNDVLRKTIRKNFNYYTKSLNTTTEKNSCNDIFRTLPILNKIKKIDGWLKDEEADLLISTTIQLCIQLPLPHTIVEVGCYHGKSTIIFGSVLQKFSPNSKIYSVDVHDGKIGSIEEGLQTVPSSYNSFKKNIHEAGINDMVEIFRQRADSMNWNKPVSMLFIDGLHDYINTIKDFKQFDAWIIKNGYVIFHDYASYFPGVVAFVNELLNAGEYYNLCQVESLIVLKKK